MGLETRYEYIYYTVVDINQWRRGNEEIFGEDGFTWENACKFINTKFEKNEDDNTCNFRVENAHFCDDIDGWRRAVIRNKERPVFVQFQDNQQIKLTGEGSMFILYEEEEDDEVTIEQAINDHSYWNGPDGIDGLSGAGGRL